jgi:hypothetical protein
MKKPNRKLMLAASLLLVAAVLAAARPAAGVLDEGVGTWLQLRLS